MAITIHLGQRCGYDKGNPCPVKAIQFMADLYDFCEDVTKQSKSVEKLNEFLRVPAGGMQKVSWYDEWMTNIERSITGPFYFGSQPTYVDFWAAQGFDWADFVMFKSLGINHEKYPKISAVLTATRALGNAALEGKPVGPPDYAISAALAADYNKQ